MTSNVPVKEDFANLCNNIRRLRRERGISLRRLAAATGVSVYALTKLERDIVPPRATVDLLFRLAVFFGVPVWQLFV